ncbi:MAG: hypothetical protein GY778_30840 [bacterium]|nr:hypothetical protein [bacterium]
MGNQTRRRRAGWYVALAGALVFASSTQVLAQEATSIVPADAVLFLHWAGHDAVMAGDGPGSTFGKLMADPEVKRLLKAVSGAARAGLAQAAGGGDAGGGPEEALFEIGKVLWNQGALLAVLGVEPTMAGPVPQLVVAVKAGAEAEPLAEKLTAMLGFLPMMTGPTDETVAGVTFKRYDSVAPVRLGVSDGILMLTVGDKTAERVLEVKAGQAPDLMSSPRYRAALERIGAQRSGPTKPVLEFHLDAVHLLAAAKQVMAAMTGEEEFPPPVATVLDELGVLDLQSITFTEQIIGRGHRHAIYVASSGPKKGLLKLLDAEPLTEADLAAIPGDATFAKASNFRLSAVYDEVMRVIEAVGAVIPDVLEEVKGGLAELERETGLKLKEDVLDLFDDGWVVFNAPSSGGLIVTGFTLVVETTDAEKMDALIRQVLAMIALEIGGDEAVKIKSYAHGEHAVNFVNLVGMPSPVAPAWGFHEKRMVVALYPQMVAQTLDRLASSAAKSRSILENRDFARLRRRLPKKCNTITFFDTKQSVSDLYSVVLPLASAGCSMAQAEGFDLDISLLPRREVLVRDLFPDLWGVSSDDNGLLIVGYGPWPIPVPPIASLAPAVLGAGAAAMPVLARKATYDEPMDQDEADMDPETAERLRALGYLQAQPEQPDESGQETESMGEPAEAETGDAAPKSDAEQKLNNIGVALQLYAMQHQERFPPDLATLVKDGHVSDDDLSLTGPNGEELYYVGDQTLKSDPKNILVCIPIGDDRVGVVAVDGQLKVLDQQTFAQELRATQERIGG